MGPESISNINIDEIRIKEMKDAVGFFSTSEYGELGLTKVQGRRLGLLVNTGLSPNEIATREKVGEKFVWKSLNIAVNKIVNSDGYKQKEFENFTYQRSVGM